MLVRLSGYDDDWYLHFVIWTVKCISISADLAICCLQSAAQRSNTKHRLQMDDKVVMATAKDIQSYKLRHSPSVCIRPIW